MSNGNPEQDQAVQERLQILTELMRNCIKDFKSIEESNGESQGDLTIQVSVCEALSDKRIRDAFLAQFTDKFIINVFNEHEVDGDNLDYLEHCSHSRKAMALYLMVASQNVAESIKADNIMPHMISTLATIMILDGQWEIAQAFVEDIIEVDSLARLISMMCEVMGENVVTQVNDSFDEATLEQLLAGSSSPQ